jgi:hypothetical protein
MMGAQYHLQQKYFTRSFFLSQKFFPMASDFRQKSSNAVVLLTFKSALCELSGHNRQNPVIFS